MKPADLTARTAPRSIDLVSAAKTQTASNMQPRTIKAYQRYGLKVTQLLEPEKPQAKGKATFSTAGVQWSLAELGQASQGVPEIAFMAACYSFAGAAGHFMRLHDALHAEALQLRRKLAWPIRISGTDGNPRGYLSELAELVLHEDARPSIFLAAPGLFANYLGITQDLWDGQIEDRYGHVKQAYHFWLSDAHRIMAPRLRDDDAVDDE